MAVTPCSVCSNPIEIFPCHIGRNKYHFCSEKCKNTPFVKKVCIQCGNDFLVTFHNARDAKLCSTECRNARNRKNEKHKNLPKVTLTCRRCGESFRVRTSYKDKQKYCSQKCSGAAIGEKQAGENHPVWKEKIELVANIVDNHLGPTNQDRIADIAAKSTLN